MLIICRTIMCIWCASCAYQLCMQLINDRQEYRLEVLKRTKFDDIPHGWEVVTGHTEPFDENEILHHDQG